MITLDTIQVASPCSADWDAMEGDDQVRFCGGCRKNVYNLSEMSRAEAEALVNRLEGRLCVRFYTRPDGTALTQDCPVGLRAVRYRRIRKFSYAAAVALACAGSLLSGSNPAQAATVKKAAPKSQSTHSAVGHAQPNRLMGKIAMPKKATSKKIVAKKTTPTRTFLPMATMGMVERVPLTGGLTPPQANTPGKK